MKTLLDLPNELIVLIASSLTRPCDLLHFAQTSRRIHDIAIEDLYGNVTIDPRDYRPSATFWFYRSRELYKPSFTHNFHGPPYSNLLRLSDMIRSNAIPSGRTITCLSLCLSITGTANRFQTLCTILLPQLSSLKRLNLVSMEVGARGWDPEVFSLATLGASLGPLSQTLEKLYMHFALYPRQHDGWNIGSFHTFSKLKYLSVQGCILLGRCGTPVSSMPSLDSILPSGLIYLRMQCCSMYELQSLANILDTFVEDSVRVSRRMEKLIVWLNDGPGRAREQPPGIALDRSFEAMNEKARKEGLQLELVLDWKDD